MANGEIFRRLNVVEDGVADLHEQVDGIEDEQSRLTTEVRGLRQGVEEGHEFGEQLHADWRVAIAVGVLLATLMVFVMVIIATSGGG